ncbi:MAG: hypothetical protein V4621_07435 [Pseudomonadota bacterium]
MIEGLICVGFAFLFAWAVDNLQDMTAGLAWPLRVVILFGAAGLGCWVMMELIKALI